jgi:hypothetical protein
MKNFEKKFRNVIAILIGGYLIYSIHVEKVEGNLLGKTYFILWSLFAIGFGLYWGLNSKRFAEKTSLLYERMYKKTKLKSFESGIEYYKDPDVAMEGTPFFRHTL